MKILKSVLTVIFLSVFSIIWLSCEDYPVDYSVSDDPTNPSPPDGATNVSINADLYWDCEAANEGYGVTFTVYFGTNPNPPYVDVSPQITHYDPGELQKNTKYYWKIVNSDDTTGRTKSSPVWSFTTGENAGGPGGQLWSYVAGGYIDAPVLVADGKVFFGCHDHDFYALDAQTGAFLWSYTTGHFIEGGATYANDRVYFNGCDETTYCLNADTGSLVWTYDSGQWSRGQLTEVYNGNVYVGLFQGLLCLDAANGSRVWSRTFDSYHIDYGPALYNGDIYVGVENGVFYCLRSDTGGTIWSYETNGEFTSHPSVFNDRVYVGWYTEEDYVTDSYFLCLDAATGAKIWENSCGADVVSGFVSNGNGMVYCGCDNGWVYCFNASTGAEVWSCDVGTGGVLPYGDTSFGGTFYYGGQVFLGCSAGYAHNSNYVYCLDAATGNLAWRYRTAGAIGCWPVVVNDRVYVGTYNDYTMYCLATKDGQVIAGASGPGQPSEGPAAGKRGTIGESGENAGKDRGK